MKVSNFQLMSNPSVTKNIFIVNKEFDFQGEVSLEINSDVEINYSPETPMAAKVVLTLQLFKESELEKVPFHLELEVEGIFSWDEELENNREQLESLLKENAPALLYSYLRPIITATSIQANLPPLIIPLMNFKK